VRLSPGRVRGLITSNSPSFGSDLDVTLQGSNKALLEQAGKQVLAALDQQVTTASFRPDADPRQPEVQIRPDWERLEALGLTTEDVGRTIETAISGSVRPNYNGRSPGGCAGATGSKPNYPELPTRAITAFYQ
jgi:multidrug efflux pump subunit AcrB